MWSWLHPKWVGLVDIVNFWWIHSHTVWWRWWWRRFFAGKICSALFIRTYYHTSFILVLSFTMMCIPHLFLMPNKNSRISFFFFFIFIFGNSNFIKINFRSFSIAFWCSAFTDMYSMSYCDEKKVKKFYDFTLFFLWCWVCSNIFNKNA